MSGQMHGTNVHTLTVTRTNHDTQVHEPVSMDPWTEQVRLFTAQVAALLADVEIELEATIARELSGIGDDLAEEDEGLRRLRPRRFRTQPEQYSSEQFDEPMIESVRWALNEVKFSFSESTANRPSESGSCIRRVSGEIEPRTKRRRHHDGCPV